MATCGGQCNAQLTVLVGVGHKVPDTSSLVPNTINKHAPIALVSSIAHPIKIAINVCSDYLAVNNIDVNEVFV